MSQMNVTFFRMLALVRMVGWPVLLLAVAMGVLQTPAQAADEPCQITLGSAALRDVLQQSAQRDRVGTCREDAWYDSAGNASQHTTAGLLVWRKADNWTGYTDGDQTWINSRYG